MIYLVLEIILLFLSHWKSHGNVVIFIYIDKLQKTWTTQRMQYNEYIFLTIDCIFMMCYLEATWIILFMTN